MLTNEIAFPGVYLHQRGGEGGEGGGGGGEGGARGCGDWGNV